MRTAIRKHWLDFVAIIGLIVIAGAVAVFILGKQRLTLPAWVPLVGKDFFVLKAELATAQAVTPGQGQTVRVSGIRIGDISGVDLKDGQAVVSMAIEPKYKNLVHTDATALLRPKTGLKDMFVELNPGTGNAPVAKENWAIPINNTLPDVNPDEIFSALDQTGRDYLKLLVQGAGSGLHRAGNQLQDVLARFLPTHRDLARVNAQVALRHANLAHVIHELNVLNTELATRGPQISSLVRTSNTVFTAIGSEQANLQKALQLLPGALHQTTTTLGKVQTLAGVLRPTATDLAPVAVALDKANKATGPFFKATTPILQNQIRPFTRDAQPLVQQLTPAAQLLAQASPDLTSTFTTLNHLFNMIGYNPYGKQQYSSAMSGSFLFWLAWLSHNGNAVFSTTDANGPVRALTQTSTCQTIKALVASNALAPVALNLAGVLSNPAICG